MRTSTNLLKIILLMALMCCGLANPAWAETPGDDAPPDKASGRPPASPPPAEGSWPAYDLVESGSIEIPGQPTVLAHNEPYRPWPGFFKGHLCEMRLLLQAAYQTEADRQAGLIVALVRLTADGDGPATGGERPEEPIKASLEDCMAAFEKSFVPRMSRAANEFELLGKEISEIAGRPTFTASYGYLKAGRKNVIQTGLFLRNGRLYLIMLDADEQDQFFQRATFQRILARWIF